MHACFFFIMCVGDGAPVCAGAAAGVCAERLRGRRGGADGKAAPQRSQELQSCECLHRFLFLFVGCNDSRLPQNICLKPKGWELILLVL